MQRFSRAYSSKVSTPFAKRSASSGILDRLSKGVVVGDGGFVFALEKRGYVKAGPWTPEATVEFPDAVKQLHTEFARAGSDVMQTFTFYASEDKLENRGNYAAQAYGIQEINDSACRIAREIADKYDCLVAGGICQTPTYLTEAGKEAVKSEFRKQCRVFGKNGVDFMICEYYEHVEECIWAIETVQEEMPGIAVAGNLCIGPDGDLHGTSTGDCALRLAEAGANIIGLNCHFDPFVMLKAVEKMKVALESNGITDRYLMTQPLAFMTPDASKQGFIDLPEFPFALEPRVLTRWEIQRYAREAYDMGVRYIGGCCGFEAHHIRAVSEELEKERGRVGDSSLKHERWGGGLLMHTKPWVRARASKEYWSTLNPATGRPYSPAIAKPDAWGVTQGDAQLHQTKAREQKLK